MSMVGPEGLEPSNYFNGFGCLTGEKSLKRIQRLKGQMANPAAPPGPPPQMKSPAAHGLCANRAYAESTLHGAFNQLTSASSARFASAGRAS